MDLENMSTDWLEAGAPPELISYAGRQGRTCLELGPKRRYAAVSLAEAMLDARPKPVQKRAKKCHPVRSHELSSRDKP